MKTATRTMAFVLHFALLSVLCFAQAQPMAIVANTSSFNVDFSRQPLPIFRGGVVLARQQSPAGFSVFDVTGRLICHRDIVIPDATSLTVIDAASTQNGETIAVVVSASDANQHFSSTILFTGVNAPETK